MTRPASVRDEATAARQTARVLARSAHVARDQDPRRQAAVTLAARYAVRRAQQTSMTARRIAREATREAPADA